MDREVPEMDERELLDAQIRYYRGRAPEYDATADWRVDPFEDQWHGLEDALATFSPRGRVLEIACGTGEWTRRLLDYAEEIVALDASPEMVDLSQKKLGSERVSHVVADVFRWETEDVFDTVFFANWLSHVPVSMFERFWGIVRGRLTPNGRVFFLDEAQDAWRHEERAEAPDVVIRRLRDGSIHRAVKIFWDAKELEAELERIGWDMRVTSTGALLWGEGRPAVRGG